MAPVPDRHHERARGASAVPSRALDRGLASWPAARAAVGVRAGAALVDGAAAGRPGQARPSRLDRLAHLLRRPGGQRGPFHASQAACAACRWCRRACCSGPAWGRPGGRPAWGTCPTPTAGPGSPLSARTNKGGGVARSAAPAGAAGRLRFRPGGADAQRRHHRGGAEGPRPRLERRDTKEPDHSPFGGVYRGKTVQPTWGFGSVRKGVTMYAIHTHTQRGRDGVGEVSAGQPDPAGSSSCRDAGSSGGDGAVGVADHRGLADGAPAGNSGLGASLSVGDPPPGRVWDGEGWRPSRRWESGSGGQPGGAAPAGKGREAGGSGSVRGVVVPFPWRPKWKRPEPLERSGAWCCGLAALTAKPWRATRRACVRARRRVTLHIMRIVIPRQPSQRRLHAARFKPGNPSRVPIASSPSNHRPARASSGCRTCANTRWPARSSIGPVPARRSG